MTHDECVMRLRNACAEKDLEEVWKAFVMQIFPKDTAKISSPFGTDGIIQYGNKSIPIEVKMGSSVNNLNQFLPIAVQLCGYIKKMQNSSKEFFIPCAVMATRTRFSLIDLEHLWDYLNNVGEIDWNVSPCKLYKTHEEILRSGPSIEKMLKGLIADFSFTLNEQEIFPAKRIKRTLKQAIGLSNNSTED